MRNECNVKDFYFYFLKSNFSDDKKMYTLKWQTGDECFYLNWNEEKKIERKQVKEVIKWGNGVVGTLDAFLGERRAKLCGTFLEIGVGGGTQKQNLKWLTLARRHQIESHFHAVCLSGSEYSLKYIQTSQKYKIRIIKFTAITSLFSERENMKEGEMLWKEEI